MKVDNVKVKTKTASFIKSNIIGKKTKLTIEFEHGQSLSITQEMLITKFIKDLS